jgi:hypothetical protein
MNLNEAKQLLKKNGYSLVNEYYSNPEFDDYALMVRNALTDFYDVDIEDANWIVDSDNTADFMHSVWFEMKPKDAAQIIYSKITFNGNSVNKDEFRTVKITENTQRLKKNGHNIMSERREPDLLFRPMQLSGPEALSALSAQAGKINHIFEIVKNEFKDSITDFHLEVVSDSRNNNVYNSVSVVPQLTIGRTVIEIHNGKIYKCSVGGAPRYLGWGGNWNTDDELLELIHNWTDISGLTDLHYD